MIGHVQRVAQASDARQLRRRYAQSGARCLLNYLSRRVSLAAVHARSCDHYQWRGLSQRLAQRQTNIRDVSHRAVTVTGQANYFNFDRVVKA